MSSLILSHFSSCRFVSLIFSRPQQTKRSFKASDWNTKQRSTNGTPSAGIPMFLESRWDDFKKNVSHRYANIESVAATLPNQPNGNYIESLKMKGITASPLELVDCESFETNTGISTLLKPQLYKGRNIFAFTPEKSIHFVALLCNTPNQHNQREPSNPTLFPSHGQTWNLSDKHTDWWIEELIDSVLVWWRVLQGENGMPSRSLRNFQSLKRLDETKVFASKSKLRYPFWQWLPSQFVNWNKVRKGKFWNPAGKLDFKFN